ncbi:uncharacterized protein BO95DRAFT_516527 [Aspergillus brunneoviolaceus CBS 621.78]|uniref:Rhodopsin domain-containing protein n=2 Tax=Aspergillus TaxID=5052 RepID=A0A8G1W4H0_9EURO|nr:hypothetical protein BO95DRAFT_516527 [Aspergillus brunneoviolaceus CBS 621.78]XP_040806738.1 uncharacterized protein BO72DRAFT_443599 [Aspergillus fijiensis CBS 313.89]RAH43285.1 hypothetical protein BO95DRAFT_516527 [Aspergillus brunneoviolaceus CBS 621.78]RAK82728.1 hypothetical protein BO72DRAFT_443599 [Aspergillus fijiensis CBS 313.89]
MATQWIGVLQPPDGEESNLIDPVNQLGNNIALHTVCLTLATAGVAIRIYTRVGILKSKLGLDDYFVILSWCLTVAFSGLMFESYHWGIGRHMWDEPVTWLVPALKYFTIAQYVYLLLTPAVKLSFLFFYYRIFAPDRTMRYLILGGIAFVSISHVTVFFLTIFSCTPVSHAWNEFGEGKCWNPTILPYLSGALSSTTDLYVLLLPIRSCLGLNMTLRRRLRLLAVFSIGIFACVTSLIRLGQTHILTDSTDATWNISHIAVWAVLECNVGIFCSCMLLLPRFVERYFPKGVTSYFSRLWSSNGGSKKERSVSNGPWKDGSWQSPKPWEKSASKPAAIELGSTESLNRQSLTV